MRAKPFSRPTLIAAVELLQGHSQARFSQMVLRLGLEEAGDKNIRVWDGPISEPGSNVLEWLTPEALSPWHVSPSWQSGLRSNCIRDRAIFPGRAIRR
jgi:hypothetical protein